MVRGHPRSRKRNGLVFFDVPAGTWDWLAIRGQPHDRHDALLRATIWSAMEAGRDLTIHGRVSRHLLANLERYQDIVCRWWPRYRPVRLQADEEIDTEEVATDGRRSGACDSTVLAFSGGLDSIESLAAHRAGWRGRNTLDVATCVFVHGFDIPLSDGAFRVAMGRAKTITDHYGAELVAVRSNLKRMLPNWTTTFSGAIAAVLSLFESRFSSGLLAASTAYENLYWIDSDDGSTPWTDPLLSSDSFRIVHDFAVTRVEKTARLAREPVVWKNLRVCWQGEDLSTNCGRCEKCKRQMLCMLACGVKNLSAFRAALTPAAIRSTELPLAVVVEEWQRCYDHALEAGIGRDDIFLAVRQKLDATPASATRRTDAAHRRRTLHRATHKLLRYFRKPC